MRMENRYFASEMVTNNFLGCVEETGCATTYFVGIAINHVHVPSGMSHFRNSA